MQKAFSSPPLGREGQAGPRAKSLTASRALRIGFFVVFALVVFAAGVGVYLELRIRSAAAEIARLGSKPLPAVGQTPRSANQTSIERQHMAQDTEAVPHRGWKWVPDSALMEQQWKQAFAAIGYDRALYRGAANQIRVRLRFHELYGILGLSKAEIAAFEAEAADKNLTFNRLVSPDPQAAEAHRRSQANSMSRIVEHTLGRDYVNPFRAFLVTSDLRDMTAKLAVFSLSHGEPLNSEQAATLLQTCSEFRRIQDDAKIELDQVDWESVAAKSQNFLAPAQQKLLRAMIDTRNFDKTFQDITGLPLHRPIRGLRIP